MARKRMVSLNIVDDDVFLSMPLSAQALYYHLVMRADDDGFITPLKVMRTIGANQDDLNILILKRYVLSFSSGVVVIKAWPVMNKVQKDRYLKTTYQKELDSLTTNEWGVYTEIAKISEFVETTTVDMQDLQQNGYNSQGSLTNSEHSVNTSLTQVRLDKVRLDKVRLDNTNTNPSGVADKSKSEKTEQINNMFVYWNDQVGYEITSKAKQNRLYAGKLLADYSREDVALMIKAAALASEDQYAPGISDFIELYRKWDKLKLWGKKKGVNHAAAKF